MRLPCNIYDQIATETTSDGLVCLYIWYRVTGNAIYFNGNEFVFTTGIVKIPSGCKTLCPTYAFDGLFSIDCIRHSEDVYMIQFGDGTIFQIHYMPVGYGAIQQVLSIYTLERDAMVGAPLGISVYDAASKRLGELEEWISF